MGSITPSGLCVQFEAYSTFLVGTQKEDVSSVFTCILHGNKYFIRQSPDSSNPSWEGLELPKWPHIAILLEMPPMQDSDGHRSLDGSRAVLVSILKRADGKFFAEYLRLVSVIREGSSYHRFPNKPWSEFEVEEAARKPCEVRFIELAQEWCFI
jgi:hypothetical protein